jgi:hypothetical protein
MLKERHWNWIGFLARIGDQDWLEIDDQAQEN